VNRTVAYAQSGIPNQGPRLWLPRPVGVGLCSLVNLPSSPAHSLTRSAAPQTSDGVLLGLSTPRDAATAEGRSERARPHPVSDTRNRDRKGPALRIGPRHQGPPDSPGPLSLARTRQGHGDQPVP
jgi:hypothetical protein